MAYGGNARQVNDTGRVVLPPNGPPCVPPSSVGARVEFWLLVLVEIIQSLSPFHPFARYTDGRNDEIGVIWTITVAADAKQSIDMDLYRRQVAGFTTPLIRYAARKLFFAIDIIHTSKYFLHNPFMMRTITEVRCIEPPI